MYARHPQPLSLYFFVFSSDREKRDHALHEVKPVGWWPHPLQLTWVWLGEKYFVITFATSATVDSLLSS